MLSPSSSPPFLSLSFSDRNRVGLQDTRISRGDGGSVFVMVKDVSLTPVMPPPTANAAEEVIAEAMFDE